MRVAAVILLLLAGSTCAAPATLTGAAAAQLPNAICPVDPSEAAIADISVTYRGQEIHFCCNRCRQKFLKNPERTEQ
jgi:YHS domain-containing protein